MPELLVDDEWNYEAIERAWIYFSQNIPVAVYNHQVECAREPVFYSSSVCRDRKQWMDFVLSAWDLEAGQSILEGLVLWQSWAMEVGVERTSRWRHWASW